MSAYWAAYAGTIAGFIADFIAYYSAASRATIERSQETFEAAESIGYYEAGNDWYETGHEEALDWDRGMERDYPDWDDHDWDYGRDGYDPGDCGMDGYDAGC